MSVAARTSTGPVSLADQPRTMGIFSMTLFAVSAIITLDTVAVACALGVECITLYVIFAFLFFVPYGLVTAELGSGWPRRAASTSGCARPPGGAGGPSPPGSTG